jgi:hypothetical protein
VALDELMSNWHSGIRHAFLATWGFSEDIDTTTSLYAEWLFTRTHQAAQPHLLQRISQQGLDL